MIRLALVVAASARAPRKRPTHIELIEPLSDCRMFEPSIGNANNSRPRPTGPATRSIPPLCAAVAAGRSEEHTSELQSLMRISYAVFCLKKKKHTTHDNT